MRPASLILKNGRVVDVERGSSVPASIAVCGEHIAAIDTAERLAPLITPATRVVDVTGKTVVPGFIDCHAHVASTGISLQELDLTDVRSIRDLLDMVAQRARELPEDEPVKAWGLQENLLAENRFPTKEELDSAAPRHYVWVTRAGGHGCVVNTRLLRSLGYTSDTPDVEAVGGEPTGFLCATAYRNAGRFFHQFARPGMLKTGLRLGAERAAQAGLTTVQDPELSQVTSPEPFVEALAVGPTLPVRHVFWCRASVLSQLQGADLPRRGACIFADGAPGPWTGALFEPYSDRPDTRGVLYQSDEEANAIILEAHRLGHQIAVHATCQRAVEQIVSAYEKALDACPNADHRMRIEHGYGLTTREQLERMGRRGIILSAQPGFLHYRMDMYYKRFGGRWRQVHPQRTAVECGVLIAGGSDSNVTPFWPLLGIHCAVNHPVEEERVGVREALRWFTINAAYAAFEEKEKGTIEAGKLADLTVLGRDILLENALTIKDIPVEMTVVGGQVRYSRPNTEQGGQG